MSTEKLQIYKCEICGNLVQVLLSGHGQLVCCGEAMKLQQIQYQVSELGEKHEPVIEEREDGKWVQVKSHPMIDEHYIQFIEICSNDKSEFQLKYFNPNEVPEMKINYDKAEINAVEYCNIHRLWGNKQND